MIIAQIMRNILDDFSYNLVILTTKMFMTEFLVISAWESRLFHVEHYDVIVIGAGHAGVEAQIYQKNMA